MCANSRDRGFRGYYGKSTISPPKHSALAVARTPRRGQRQPGCWITQPSLLSFVCRKRDMPIPCMHNRAITTCADIIADGGRRATDGRTECVWHSFAQRALRCRRRGSCCPSSQAVLGLQINKRVNIEPILSGVTAMV